MNPFDLPGPQFLLAYVVFAAVVLAVVQLWRQAAEPANTPQVEMDPYAIAFLRGGANEALRVAAIVLLDRGLLLVEGAKDEERFATAKGAVATAGLRPIERRVLVHFEAPQSPERLFDEGPAAECESLQRHLEEKGLLPGAGIRAVRALMTVAGIAVLGAVAAAKIGIALSRGRSNIWFLAGLAVIASIAVAAVVNRRRTRSGDSLVADLRELFGSLKGRAETLVPGGATSELALLAAVFGVSAVPAVKFPDVPKVFKKAHASGSSTGGCGSSFSSCGASCGASCGSSCGGGGCGGGCGGGGCGGCGG